MTTIKRLHPTLKKCHCGFIGTKTELYRHFELAQKQYHGDAKAYFADHGEVPLNEDYDDNNRNH